MIKAIVVVPRELSILSSPNCSCVLSFKKTTWRHSCETEASTGRLRTTSGKPQSTNRHDNGQDYNTCLGLSPRLSQHTNDVVDVAASRGWDIDTAVPRGYGL
mmetsp:Transcript_18742/g.43528  ORF Transcript_18742/g.43528 Transcript_18742/m.43528 type:complete len:102 (+) Transcript_18742:1724-2029(+)